jgi:superfamily I DNA/RNA helicase
VLESYRDRFRYILVDEYQDTNSAQYEWLKLLAEPRRNLCCVGDDDQSIYSWRGAEVANILKFGQDFPGAKIIRLEQNYRSTSHILAAADGLIAHNAGRLGKSLWTDRGEGEKVRVIGVWDGPEEARRVGEEIESSQARGKRLSDIAILVRAQFQTREFEERFIGIGLPYQIIGGYRFYERAEIRDALAYLRLIHQPADDLAFERIVNQPKRGLGDKAIATIHRAARRTAAAAADRRRDPSRQRRAPGPRPQLARPLHRRHRPLAQLYGSSEGGRGVGERGRGPARRARPHRPRGERLHRDAPGRAHRRGRRPPRKPRRARPRDGGI